MSKVGRNDPCPCGSGKKYKKCCLKKNATQLYHEQNRKNEMVYDIVNFINRYYKDEFEKAYEYIWGEKDPLSSLTGELHNSIKVNVMEWFIHDWMVSNKEDKTILELYIEKNKYIEREKLSVLEKMKNSFLSLYEVNDVSPNEYLVIKDLLLGEKYTVVEKTASQTLTQGDIFAARILNLDDRYIFSAGIYQYKKEQKEIILDDINGFYAEYKKDYPYLTFQNFIQSRSEMFIDYWVENISEHIPTFVNTDGDALVISKAYFKITDKGSLISGLKKSDEFIEEGENKFVWLEYNDINEGSDRVFATIDIRDTEIVLETNSVERLNVGKDILLDDFSDVIVHREDVFTDTNEII